MSITHIEHIGIAVSSLEETIPFYEQMLGTKCYNIEEVKDQIKQAVMETKMQSVLANERAKLNVQILKPTLK